jgi:thiol-disulfide isomerase/thioredoxin
MIRYLISVFLFFTLIVFAQNNSTIELVDKDNINQLISSRNGKVLLVNVWATWCIPCKEEIPDLNKIHQKYSAEVDVVGISVDFPEEIKKRILPFLDQNIVEYKVVVSNFKKDNELIDLLNLKWGGALPASFIFNKTGKQVEFIEGKRSFSEFEKLLQSHLK